MTGDAFQRKSGGGKRGRNWRGWKSKRGKFANRGSPRKQGHPNAEIRESDEEGLRGKRVAARLLLILAWTSEETFLFEGRGRRAPVGGGVGGESPCSPRGRRLRQRSAILEFSMLLNFCHPRPPRPHTSRVRCERGKVSVRFFREGGKILMFDNKKIFKKIYALSSKSVILRSFCII